MQRQRLAGIYMRRYTVHEQGSVSNKYSQCSNLNMTEYVCTRTEVRSINMTVKLAS